jgi:hypothetical protein
MEPLIALIVVLAIIFLLWVLPVWVVATNNNLHRYEKLAYVVGIVLLSPIVFIIYLFLAPSR